MKRTGTGSTRIDARDAVHPMHGVRAVRWGRRWGVTLAAALAVLAAACEKPVTTPVAEGAVQDIKADAVVYGMTSYLFAAGVRQGKIQADTAYAYTDSSAYNLVGMHVVFYGDDGRERARVTADGGRMNQRTQEMVARGHVVLIVAADGRRIESAELNYDPNRDLIWSDSATVETMADGTVTRGSFFKSDLEFKNITVGNIRGGSGIVF